MTYTGIGIGVGATVSYLEETVQGTMDTSPVWVQVGVVTGGDISLSEEHVSAYGLGDADRLGAPAGNKGYELTLDFLITSESWDFLTLFDGGDKTYTFMIQQPLYNTNTHYIYCVGARLAENNVSGSQGGLWEASCTIKFVGLSGDAIVDAEVVGSTDYTPSTDVPTITNVGSFNTGLGWDSSGLEADITDCDWSVSHNFSENYVLNSSNPEGIYAGRTEVSFSFSANWIDDGTDINLHFTRILDSEAGALVMKLVEAGYNATLAGCAYDELSVGLSEGEKSTLEISGTADTLALAPT